MELLLNIASDLSFNERKGLRLLCRIAAYNEVIFADLFDRVSLSWKDALDVLEWIKMLKVTHAPVFPSCVRSLSISSRDSSFIATFNAEQLGAILAAFENVMEIKLDFRYSRHIKPSQTIERVLGDQQWPNLCHIKIDEFVFSQEGAIDFLSRHRGTLKTVVLNVSLVPHVDHSRRYHRIHEAMMFHLFDRYLPRLAILGKLEMVQLHALHQDWHHLCLFDTLGRYRTSKGTVLAADIPGSHEDMQAYLSHKGNSLHARGWSTKNQDEREDALL